MKKVAFYSIGVMLFVCFTMALMGCQSAVAASPTPAVATPVPTVEPTHILTPAPTVAPVPTETPTETEEPVPTETPDLDALFVEKMLSMVNDARVEHGLEQLELSPSLCAAAKIRADEYMQKWVASNGTLIPNSGEMHVRLDGRKFSTALDEVGIIRDWKLAGENVVSAIKSMGVSEKGINSEATQMFTWWKGSSGHWEAILSKKWIKTGIAIVHNDTDAFAVQLFTTGHNEPPAYQTSNP